MNATIRNLTNERQMFYVESNSILRVGILTLLRPLTLASRRASFDMRKAFPPRTARNWNPIGTKTIRKIVMPINIIEIACCCRRLLGVTAVPLSDAPEKLIDIVH